LSSLRRVKKGPGRRPLSAKRQRFMELRGRGWSILAAGREVGVSRTTANNWSRGYKTYRHGQVVGFVPALERLAVRRISSRFVSQEERIEIADLRHAGLSIRAIAQRLRRAASRSHVKCAATPLATAAIVPSRRTDGRRLAGLAVIADASRPTPNCGSSSQRCWTSGGVRSRSAGNSGPGSPDRPGDGCATRVSTRRSTSQDQH
jgi:Helix-turn-helix domain